MVIQLGVPETHTIKPCITVIGIGGGGGNAVNNMIVNGLSGVEFVVANTDAQALEQSRANRRIQFGASVTQGLGAGSRPDIGKAAAEEAMDQITEQLSGSHMVFITAGMGGGTGTGAAPVVARVSREMGMLTIGFVTMPFDFEGRERMRMAEKGVEELQDEVDTLVVIPNQNLFRVANDKTTFADAFKMADNVLHTGVRGITDLMVQPGIINLDFADVRRVISERGTAMMGTGEASGEKRAIEAAEAAISNPLLDEVSMKGACGVLINVTGGNDMKLFEVDEAARRINQETDPEAHVIIGAAYDENMDGMMRVSLVATGINMADPPASMTTRARVDTVAAAALVADLPEPADEQEAAEAVAQARDGLREKFTAIDGGKAFEPAPQRAAAVAEPEPDTWQFEEDSRAATGAGAADRKEAQRSALDAFIAPRPVLPQDMPAATAHHEEAEEIQAPRKASFIERVTGMRGSRDRQSAREPVIDRPEHGLDAGRNGDYPPDYPGHGAGPPKSLFDDDFEKDDNLEIPPFLRRKE